MVFGAVGIGDAEKVAGKFDQGVLKSGTSAEEGPVAAAGKLDTLKHAVETLEGTSGGGPQPVEGFQRLF